MKSITIERLKQKYSRLKSMNRDEMGYRARALGRASLQRIEYKLSRSRKSGSSIPWVTSSNASNVRSYLINTCASRFYLPTSPTERENLRRFFEDQFPEWKNRAISEAKKLYEHRVDLLGYENVSLGEQIQWNRDPMTGGVWPTRFWSDYDLMAAGLPGDPKNIHELGRCQHLPRLGKAYFLTKDEKYAEEALHEMLCWIDQNPVRQGIHWNSSLEIGLRTISWLWTLFFIVDSLSVGEDSLTRLLSSIAEQLEHVHQFLSEYSSPNTHLLGEALALYIGGSIFPEWKPASQWRCTGERILAQEIQNQFTKDGFHGELSTYYHCYALDFYLQAAILSISNDGRWTSAWWRRIEQMVDVVMALVRPGGSLPWLGDEDGGRALALERTNYKSTKDLLCTAAVLFGRPQFKHAAGAFCEETLWLFGTKAWWIFETMESKTPRQLQTLYQDSGLAIQRSDWSDETKHLVFDFGGMGLFRGGHGHADALSIVLSIANEEVLTDPGTGIYNGAREWRNFFRSSQAHNTAIVDRCQQSEPGDSFGWRQVAATRMARSLDYPPLSFVEAEHTGFLRLEQGVTHRRGILYCRPDCWMVVDRFLGTGSHDIDLLYHFAREASVEISERCKSENDRQIRVNARTGTVDLGMFFVAEHPIEADLDVGNIQGWISPKYGQRFPAPCLRLKMNGPVPSRVVSLFSPLTQENGQGSKLSDRSLANIRQIPVKNGKAIALESPGKDHHDLWIVASGDQEIEVAGFEVRGEILWIRSLPNRAKQLFALNTSHFNYEGLHPSSRISTFYSSILVAWDEEGHMIGQPHQAEDLLCVESAEL